MKYLYTVLLLCITFCACEEVETVTRALSIDIDRSIVSEDSTLLYDPIATFDYIVETLKIIDAMDDGALIRISQINDKSHSTPILITIPAFKGTYFDMNVGERNELITAALAKLKSTLMAYSQPIGFSETKIVRATMASSEWLIAQNADSRMLLTISDYCEHSKKGGSSFYVHKRNPKRLAEEDIILGYLEAFAKECPMDLTEIEVLMAKSGIRNADDLSYYSERIMKRFYEDRGGTTKKVTAI